MRASGRKAAWIAGALVAGAGLRAAFIAWHPAFDSDALTYGELAHNLLAHHMYEQMDDVLRPTLIRMPGYPVFLAACFKLFGDANYLAVLWVQAVVDLATCGLIATLAARVAGKRAGWWALWLSVLCPFTANYTAAALTETCSLFCVALGFYGLERWVSAWRSQLSAHTTRAKMGHPEMRWAVVIGLALAWAVFLRPDEGLLAAAVLPVMAWVGWRAHSTHRRAHTTRAQRGHPVWLAPVAVTALFVAVPLALWGLRNWRVFHVVQPLVTRYANDPDEEVPYGFMRWYRTWAIGYPATMNVYWNYDGSAVDVRDLPARAFDNARERAETMAVFAEYNRTQNSTPAVDAEFARLAEERVRAHPVEYYVLLPVAREMNMWFWPRMAMLNLPVDWWRVREHPWPSAEAMGLALLNAAYLVLAAVGIVRWRRARWSGQAALAWAMGAFVVLRCALLLTLDNAEMRYTLECYPVVLVLCGVAAAGANALAEDRLKSAA